MIGKYRIEIDVEGSLSRFIYCDRNLLNYLKNSEVCHPRCEFKLYSEMNSVKKHNYKLWLNEAIY